MYFPLIVESPDYSLKYQREVLSKHYNLDLTFDSLDKTYDYLKKGDEIVCLSPSLIASSPKGLAQTLDKLEKLGVKTKFITHPLSANQARLFGQIHSEMVKRNTDISRKKAISTGVKFGPKNKLNNRDLAQIKNRIQNGFSRKEICSEFGIGSATLARYLKRSRENETK